MYLRYPLPKTISEILLRPVLGVALNSLQKHKLNLMALAALILSASLSVTIVANSYRAFIAVMIFQGASIAFCGGLPTSKFSFMITILSVRNRYHMRPSGVQQTSNRVRLLRLHNGCLVHDRAASLFQPIRIFFPRGDKIVSKHHKSFFFSAYLYFGCDGRNALVWNSPSDKMFC